MLRPVPPAATTALINAAAKGDTETLGLILGTGTDINAPDERGRTALHAAVTEGHRDVVQHLLALGADPLVHNTDGLTPLLIAITSVKTSVVDGRALHPICPKKGAQRSEIIADLLAAGADPNDVAGRPPTSLGVQRSALGWAAGFGDTATVAALLAAGARVTGSDHEVVFPLGVAAENGHVDVLRLLLAAGADPNASTRTGRETALMGAAEYGHQDAARVLLAAGANIDAQSFDGLSALMFAARDRKSAVAALLVAAGANTMLTNNQGATAENMTSDPATKAVLRAGRDRQTLLAVVGAPAPAAGRPPHKM